MTRWIDDEIYYNDGSLDKKPMLDADDKDDMLKSVHLSVFV